MEQKRLDFLRELSQAACRRGMNTPACDKPISVSKCEGRGAPEPARGPPGQEPGRAKQRSQSPECHTQSPGANPVCRGETLDPSRGTHRVGPLMLPNSPILQPGSPPVSHTGDIYSRRNRGSGWIWGSVRHHQHSSPPDGTRPGRHWCSDRF